MCNVWTKECRPAAQPVVVQAAQPADGQPAVFRKLKIYLVLVNSNTIITILVY